MLNIIISLYNIVSDSFSESALYTKTTIRDWLTTLIYNSFFICSLEFFLSISCQNNWAVFGSFLTNNWRTHLFEWFVLYFGKKIIWTCFNFFSWFWLYYVMFIFVICLSLIWIMFMDMIENFILIKMCCRVKLTFTHFLLFIYHLWRYFLIYIYVWIGI